MEILGEGRQGIVYKSWDETRARWVAVKVLHTVEIGPDRTIWHEAARKFSSLDHPHIASLYDIGEKQGQPYLETEYLPGGTLKAQIRALRAVGDSLTFEDITRHAAQIGDALIYAHSRGVYHRNLKTENVMFSEEGEVKLTDFDLTPVPESNLAEQSDISGFGSVLYEMATGNVPLPGLPAPPLGRVREDLPGDLTDIVARTLEPNHPRRYRQILALVGDLKSLTEQTHEQSQETKLSDGEARPAFQPLFSPGRLLAERFRIVRFLAKGGMGEVYEAEDLELREHVALKTVRAGFAQQDRALGRFKREIQLARQVTHSNVCRIYDVFHHVEPRDSSKGPAEKITFLSMELLRGETLAERLQQTGPILPAEALPMVIQMTAALAAAHQAGVVHRDFKSSNVMLVPSPGSPGETRVVVTDFGLAHSSKVNEGLLTALPGTVELVGTPAYMAPEQLEGGEITPATDIYAFGIVLFEMLTGKLPFVADSSFAVALKRLTEAAPSPRIHVPDLDSRWESAILQCLERDPAARFSSITDAAGALQEKPAPPQPQIIERPRFLKRNRFAVAAGAVLVLGLLIATAVRFSSVPVGEGRPRRSVAVLGFTNVSGDADVAWLSTGLAEMLTTELAAGEQLRAIPGENVARMKGELSLPESSSFAPDTLTRIRNYLGADVIILGSYYVTNGNPNKVRVDLRLQDSATGDLLAAIGDDAYPTEILDLVSRSGARLREKLGVQLSTDQADLAHAAHPINTQAARFYAEGLEKLRNFDGLEARSLLEKAVNADPNNALTRAALATSWSMLGYAIKAREEAKKAVDLSVKLSREERLAVEGRYSETAFDWNQAAEVYRTLFGFFPDNLEYGLRLAAAQASAGKAKDAIATVATLRKFSTLDGNSPRIDMAEARVAGELSDFKRQQTLAASAAAKGQSAGARLLVAGARLLEGSALASMGKLEEARSAFEDSRKMYASAGDRWDAANASTNLAYVLAKSGDLSGARRIFDDSLAIYHELGDRRSMAAVLVAKASLFRSQADLAGARSMHEQALAIYRETGDRVGEAKSLNNIANILGVTGDLSGARKMYQTALPIFRETGERNAAATVLGNLGDLFADEGDLALAAELHEQSLATFRELDNRSSIAYALTRLGDLQLIKGDLEKARERHEGALAVRTEIGEKGGIADSQLALAQIALQEGVPDRAEATARAAIEQFRTQGRSDDEASGMAVLARSLLAQQKLADARDAGVRAEELAKKSNNGSLRLSVAITIASLRAATGETAKASTDLGRIAAEARKSGFIALELEARLASAQIELDAGRLDSGRARLVTLEREASQKGYKYLADRAAAALRNVPASGTTKNKI